MSKFTEFIESGTIKRGTVELHLNAALLDQMQPLARRIQNVRAQEKLDAENGDRAMSSKSELPALESEYDSLWEQYEASKFVVHVRALTQDERDEVEEKNPIPDAPLMPNRSAPAAIAQAWEKRRDEWKPRALRIEREQRMALMSIAVERVVYPDGSEGTLTVDDIKAMYARPYGKESFAKVWLKIDDVSRQGEAPVPFSQRGSESTPD